MSLWSIKTYTTVPVPLLGFLRMGSRSLQLITGYIAAPLRFPQLVPYYVGTTMQKQKHLTNARRFELVGSHDVTLQLFQRCLPQPGEGGRHRQNGVEEARKVGGKRLIRPLVGWCGWLVVDVGGNGHSTY
ncbi:hypothetical protein CPAR01_13414 [Colletotrichum paranaense]|uniref:Uncharacterized protein n=1 Tax=Colletotrichum paranaense TaxID=1914294 RepID=A0ABQ9S604_9PEZI|nr:uncharacterized protein CPAR01_13414 [Colletotrichum paranaense]KAK1526886.1 hypothetical protein CPAR01_13414 [Colletotrichum paranaense]